MWSSWVKEKDTTHVMYIAKLKDGPKRVKKNFSMILERVFEMVWWRGRKWNHIKKDFLKDFGKGFSSSLFFDPSLLEDLGVLMIFEEITSSKTSFQMASIYWWWMHILEWSYARQQG
jgi:hypothetical protein